MVIIKTYGLDPYLLRELSKDLNDRLLKIYEKKNEEITFIGNECLLVNNGVEQNTWNSFIEVISPKEYKIFEKEIDKILTHYFSEVVINIEILFTYFERSNYYLHLNPKFDRYLKEKEENISNDYLDKDNYSYSEIESSEDIFLGDAFIEFNKKDK